MKHRVAEEKKFNFYPAEPFAFSAEMGWQRVQDSVQWWAKRPVSVGKGMSTSCIYVAGKPMRRVGPVSLTSARNRLKQLRRLLNRETCKDSKCQIVLAVAPYYNVEDSSGTGPRVVGLNPSYYFLGASLLSREACTDLVPLTRKWKQKRPHI